MKKRILSLILAVAMVLALFPAAALADGAADPLPSEELSELMEEESMGAQASFNVTLSDANNNGYGLAVSIFDSDWNYVERIGNSLITSGTQQLEGEHYFIAAKPGYETVTGTFTPGTAKSVSLNAAAIGEVLGNEYFNSGWTQNNKDITIESGYKRVITFKVYNGGSANEYSNFSLETDGWDNKTTGFYLQSGQYGNGAFYTNDTTNVRSGGGAPTGQSFNNRINGSTVSMTISNASDGRIDVEWEFLNTKRTETEGNIKQTISNLRGNAGQSEEFHLHADSGYLTNIVVNDEEPITPLATADYTFTGLPVGAAVTIDGITQEANAEHVATFTGLTVGSHTYSITAAGYAEGSGSIEVTESGPNTQAISLTPVYAFTFTGLPEGAAVTIGESTKTANAEGVATFTDLTVGSHDYSITATGYANKTGSIEVTESGPNTQAISLTPVYAVTFTGNAGALVTISKAGEQVDTVTLTNGTGTVYLSDGDYTYTATADGYNDAPGNFTVNGKAVTDLEIEMTEKTTVTKTTVGAADNTTAYLGDFTDTWTVPVGSQAIVRFKNYSSKENNWNNFVLLVGSTATVTDGLLVALRADNWDNKTDNNTDVTSNFNWDTFKNDLDGASVVAKAVHTEGSVLVRADITTTSGANYFVQKTITTTSNPVYFKITVNHSHLTDVEGTVTSHVVGETNYSSGWWTAFSPAWQVPANSKATMTFTGYNNETLNWHNPIVVLQKTSGHTGDAGYEEYGVMRTDNYGWKGAHNTNDNGTNTVGWGVENNWDWDTIKSFTNGATVTLTVYNYGSSADVRMDFEKDGTNHHQYYNGITVNGDVFFRLTVENAYITYDAAPTISYLVSFTGVEGATVKVYSDAARATEIADYSYLPIGTYYYTASKDGYEDAEDEFTVSDAAVPVPVPVTFTTIPADQIGKSNNTTGFFGAHSANVAVAPGQISTATFTNHSGYTGKVWNEESQALIDGDDSYLNFLVQLLNGELAEIAVLRADGFGWIGADNTNSGLLSRPTDPWIRNMVEWTASALSTEGQVITLTVANDGSYVWVTAKTIIEGKNATLQYAVPCTGTVYYNLSVDHSYITGLSQTPTATSLLLSQYAVKFAGETTLYYKVTVPESYAGYTVKFYKGSEETPYRNLAPTTLAANTTEIKLPILPRDMASQFTMKVFDTEGGEVDFYSVSGSHYDAATHLVYAAQSYAANAPEAAQTLVNRYVDYGKAAAWYFGDSTTAPEITGSVLDLNLANMSGIALPSAAKKSGYTLNKPSVSVMFESNNSVRAYVSGAAVTDSLTYQVLVGDEVMKGPKALETRDTYTYMATNGIAANDLDKVYKLELFDGNTRIARITTSALGYAKLLYNTYKDSTSTDEDLTGYKSKVLAQALYAYWSAAEAYFAE